MIKRTFAQLQTENRRCAFLRFLNEDPDYSMNTSILQGMASVVTPSTATRHGWRSRGW